MTHTAPLPADARGRNANHAVQSRRHRNHLGAAQDVDLTSCGRHSHGRRQPRGNSLPLVGVRDHLVQHVSDE